MEVSPGFHRQLRARQATQLAVRAAHRPQEMGEPIISLSEGKAETAKIASSSESMSK